MIPVKSAGSNLFDFISLGSDSLAIAIGDVADKSIPADLFMAMVRSLLRAETHLGESPREVLAISIALVYCGRMWYKIPLFKSCAVAEHIKAHFFRNVLSVKTSAAN